MSSPAVSLLDLLDELLDHLFTFLSKFSLLSVCGVSKRINRIATPQLYSSISFQLPDDWTAPMLCLRPFAYLVFTSEVHAGYVREMGLDIWAPWDGISLDEAPVIEAIAQEYSDSDDDNEKDDDDGEEGEGEEKRRERNRRPHAGMILSTRKFTKPWPVHEGPERLEEVLRAACRRYTINEEDANEVYKLITQPSKDITGHQYCPLIALIIVHLPKLRRLYITGGLDEGQPMFRVLQLVTQGRRHQQGDSSGDAVPLEILVSRVDSGYDEMTNSSQIPPLLQLPNLRSCYAWKPLGYGESYDHLPPRSVRVETVEWRAAGLERPHLFPLLAAMTPGKLKTFQYEIGYHLIRNGTFHKEIIEKLAPHYGTLENLELSHVDKFGIEFTDIDPNMAVIEPVSFQAFEKLKKLKVAAVYIWGSNTVDFPRLNDGIDEEFEPQYEEMLWKALPSALEELWITRLLVEFPSSICSHLGHAMVSLDCHRDAVLPFLKTICILFAITTPVKSIEFLRTVHGWAHTLRLGEVTVWMAPTMKERGFFFPEYRQKWGWLEDIEWKWDDSPRDLADKPPRCVVEKRTLERWGMEIGEARMAEGRPMVSLFDD